MSNCISEIILITNEIPIYRPIRRGGPTCKSKSSIPLLLPVKDGNPDGSDTTGKMSGINTPAKAISIEPLIKSCKY